MRVKVSLQNIDDNIAKVKTQLNCGVKLCAVVKANAYGHGLAQVAQYVENSADCFAVARLDEATLLRQVGVKKQVLVLNPLFTRQEIALAGKNDITLTADSADNLQMLADNGVSVHIKTDSGMNRLGLKRADEAEKLFFVCKELGVKVEGVYSHFASAINSNAGMMFYQYRRFCKFTQIASAYFPKAVRHICNTSAALCCPAFQCDMVRVGIGLYGYSDRKNFPLKKCKTVSAQVVETKTVPKGQTVGYDCKFTADSDTQIAVVDCGYGDGLPRAFCGGSVITQYGKADVVGSICMDLMMIKNPDGRLKAGDEVIILGEYGKSCVSADEIAAICGTIPYEILCNLRNR